MASRPVTGRALTSLALYHKVTRRVHGHGRSAVAVARERSCFYEQAWHDAAAAVGAHIEPIDGPLLRVEVAGRRLLVRDNLTSLDDPVTLAIAGDKPLVYRLLAAEGIPVAPHVVVPRDDLAAAWAFCSTLDAPCVAKPALDGAAGAGVTTGIGGRTHLAGALARAGAWSDDVLLERQVEGGSYRLLYFDGELLDAVLRGAPVLHGDGHSSLRQLIAAENAERASRGVAVAQSLLLIDRDLRATLGRQGYRLGSVPDAGVLIQAKGVVNDNRREDNVAVTGELCAELVETGAAAARAVGARLAGVDVITTDPGVPLARSGGVVLEVNTTPGYYYHYHRRGPEAPVATMILERLARAGRS